MSQKYLKLYPFECCKTMTIIEYFMEIEKIPVTKANMMIKQIKKKLFCKLFKSQEFRLFVQKFKDFTTIVYKKIKINKLMCWTAKKKKLMTL